MCCQRASTIASRLMSMTTSRCAPRPRAQTHTPVQRAGFSSINGSTSRHAPGSQCRGAEGAIMHRPPPPGPQGVHMPPQMQWRPWAGPGIHHYCTGTDCCFKSRHGQMGVASKIAAITDACLPLLPIHLQAMRLFVGEPVWTPLNRPQEGHASRANYLRTFGAGTVAAT